MERIWTAVMLTGIAAALCGGRSGSTAEALLGSGARAVELTLMLTGSMMLWSGFLGILEETGDTARIGRLLRRVCAPLFPGVSDAAAWKAMSMNLAANVLGLGNAATPAGIAAARLLATQGQCGLQALAMLLALNNSSLQLLPTTVITLRAAAGSADPAGIWPAALAASAVSTVTAAALMTVVRRVGGGRG